MTGSASNLTFNLVLHHDKLKTMNQVLLRGALVEVSRIQILLLDWAQKVGPDTCVTQPCMCIISWDTRVPNQKKANQDSLSMKKNEVLHAHRRRAILYRYMQFFYLLL